MTPSKTIGDVLLAAGTWNLDPDESTIGFRVAALPPAKGKFTRHAGELIVDDDHRATATASIEVDSLRVGPRLRDRHLKSAHFFDLVNHPRITFRSERIEQDNDQIRFHGTLSIRGQEQLVEVAGEVSSVGEDAVRLRLSGRINRRDFGVTWLSVDRFMFGDQVTLDLDLVARRA